MKNKSQQILESVLQFLVEYNKGDITCFYPKDYVKRLEFIKENINTQIDKIILHESKTKECSK
tara:strand:- start:960 stop:1148 length:189 start_codon:yes stop_codon:yes gene_type:complete